MPSRAICAELNPAISEPPSQIEPLAGGVIPISGVFRLTPHQIFTNVFGTVPAVLDQASPLSHARPDAPPFLILYADDDFPSCNRPFAQAA